MKGEVKSDNIYFNNAYDRAMRSDMLRYCKDVV